MNSICPGLSTETGKEESKIEPKKKNKGAGRILELRPTHFQNKTNTDLVRWEWSPLIRCGSPTFHILWLVYIILSYRVGKEINYLTRDFHNQTFPTSIHSL